ncbi:iron complex transport system substrate-binding protein [Halovenus aranensis]|uniref:Iron complex transport system substrate-binding protein n=2 Tax=Halovenus aranensis TaxID=890420 RepID=A0A1G8UAH4_9EURY|nr:iron complex transport system substrate-binding protein [Halovenus aranensis]
MLLVVGAASGMVVTDGIVGETTAQDSDECTFPVSATDATGTEVTVDEEPESVVTLNPSAAQTLWEIGAKDKVTGVTKHASNLEGASERTNISTAGQTITHEVVVDLEPDLVLAPLSAVTTEEDVETLRDAGLTVFAYPTAESIDEVRQRTLQTGEFVGECEGATETVEWMDEKLSVVEDAVDEQEKPKVLYTFFGYTSGTNTFIHEILETAGGVNIAAEAGIEGYQQINQEVVVTEDPEWIVLNSDSTEVPDGNGFQETTAVKQNQTVVIDTNRLNRPAPRIVYAVTELAETFHPDAYEEAVKAAQSTPTPTPTESPTETEPTPTETEPTATATQTPAATETPTATQTPENSDGDGAGFGVLAVVGSVVLVNALVLGARRRNDGH